MRNEPPLESLAADDPVRQPLQLLSDEELLRRLAELTGRSRHVEAASPLRGRGVPAHHRRSRRTPAFGPARHAGRRPAAPHRAIAFLAPHLTDDNREAVLARAVHRSKHEVENLVAELSPGTDVPALIRKLPERAATMPTQEATPPVSMRLSVAAATATAASEPAVSAGQLCPDGVLAHSSPRTDTVRPIALGRYKVQFTASAELRHKLERLRGLMRSSIPDGDLAALIEDAVTEKLARLEATRFARTGHPRTSIAEVDARPSSRHVPAAVRRAVMARDGQRCAYTDAAGRRCTATDRLEFHHRRPFGVGGDHAVANMALLCRAHNSFLAEIDYGGAG